MNSRQSLNNHWYFTGTINEEDNFEEIVEWIKSGEFTPKLFAKHLRHTAKDISQGLRPFNKVGMSLMTSYLCNSESDHTAMLKVLCSALATVVLPPQTSPTDRMMVSTWLGGFLYYRFHRKDATGSVIDVNSSLADALKSIRSFIMKDDEWADRVGGSFRLVSPVYRLSETQFVDKVCKKVGDIDSKELLRACEMTRRTANEVLRLNWDYDPIFYACWECGKAFGNILRCGECKAARYCSTKCQKAAWKGGHKKKCKRTKLVYEFLLENVEEVERAHVTGVQDSFELSPRSDCLTMKICLDHVAQFGDSESEGLECSMKVFYENLGRIIRGEWWIFDLSEQEEYAGNAHKAKTHADIVVVLHMLTLDWFEQTRLMLGIASVDPQQVTEFTDPLLRTKCSSPMSASTLLEIYQVVEPKMQFRPPFKVRAFARLRGVYYELE